MDPGLFVLASGLAAALGGWWLRGRSERGSHAELAAARQLFGDDVEVALHVARHEAETRGHEVSTLHVLYGVVQDDAIAAAVAASGGEVARIEDAIAAALDTRAAGEAAAGFREVQRALGMAVHVAQHAGRRVTCTDVWAYLGESEAAAALAAADVQRGAVLFGLVHGHESPIDGVAAGDAHAVLRNDDYTTQEFVCELLEQVFGLATGGAQAVMAVTHRSGRGVIGRFPVADARERIVEARRLAREAGYPLWVGIEPV